IRVRVYDVDGVHVDQFLEAVFKGEDVFPGLRRRRRRLGYLTPLLRVMPGDDVFDVGEIVLFNGTGNFDGFIHTKVSPVIRSHGDLIPYRRAHDIEEFQKAIHTFLGDLNSREWVFCHIVLTILVLVWIETAVGRVYQRTRDIPQQVDPDVHLQRSVALLDAFHHPVRIFLGILRDGRIAIDSYAVAVFTAEQHIDGYVIGLPCKVPKRHFHTGDAAPLPSMVAELADFLEQPFNITRVFAQEPTLEKKGVFFGSTIPDVAVPYNTLICVDPHD